MLIPSTVFGQSYEKQPSFKNLDTLSKKNATIVEKNIYNKENLIYDEFTRDGKSQIFKTDDVNTYICVTNGYVEVIRQNGDQFLVKDDVVTATLKNVEAKREVMSRGGGSYIEINDPGFGTLSKVGKYEVEVKTSNMIATYSVAAITFIVSRRISGDVCVQGGLTIASINSI